MAERDDCPDMVVTASRKRAPVQQAFWLSVPEAAITVSNHCVRYRCPGTTADGVR